MYLEKQNDLLHRNVWDGSAPLLQLCFRVVLIVEIKNISGVTCGLRVTEHNNIYTIA